MKIVLIGYGKMGHMIEGVARERGHEIVGVIDPTLRMDDCVLAIDFDSDAFRSADVAIEFTTPATARENILRAWAQSVPVVCGTTGWDAQELLEEDKRLHTKPMLVWKSNFSVGVNIFFELNKFLAEKILQSAADYQPSIKEIHHIHKLDAPSGTAKSMAEIVAEHLGVRPDITSIREGEVPGTHVVKFKSEVDKIKVSHEAFSRQGFAEGAVVAAQMTEGLTGVHTFKELIIK